MQVRVALSMALKVVVLSGEAVAARAIDFIMGIDTRNRRSRSPSWQASNVVIHGIRPKFKRHAS